MANGSSHVSCSVPLFALAYLLHCIILLLAHINSYMLDRMEPELKEPMEQAQIKDFTNLALNQGKP
jgi:hypothetical protein